MKPLLLASGLPLRPERPTSFERQLRLLAAGWRARGREAEVSGPQPPGLAAAEAGILLGYPDQFPALRDPPPGVPLFLWAQCSRPPDPRGFGEATAVPLTPFTEGFLTRAGVRRVGPVVPHAVDTVLFRPPSERERAQARQGLGVGRRFAVGCLGAHTYRKRFDLVLRSFALLRELRPDCLLVLHTDREVSPEGTDLRKLAGRLGIEAALALVTGELPPPGMQQLYWALDAFVCLSEWEGFGLPAAEAMACGLPLVTHRVQGPGELACPELTAGDSEGRLENGSLLLAARPETAAALLERLAGDPPLAMRLGWEGRAVVERRCSLPRVLESWEGLLRTDRG